MTALKRNIVANYLGQGWVSLLGLVMVPIYVQWMGPEAYGLVGVFTMLQVWFQLLDIGLSQTLTRDAARFRGGAVDARQLRAIYRTIELVFWAVSAMGGLLLLVAAPWFVPRWLHFQAMEPAVAVDCVRMMAVVCALRLATGPQRSLLMGFERQVWMNGFTIVAGSLRSIGVLAFFVWLGATPRVFFGYQLAIAGIEIVVLSWSATASLPHLPSGEPVRAGLSCLRSAGGFPLVIAFTSSVWLAVTYTDRLVLSKILTLSDFGFYSVAAAAANVVNLISAPIGAALLPRLVAVAACGVDAEFFRLYRGFSQIVCWIAFSTALSFAFFAKQALWVWTGNLELAAYSALPLRLYALGNAVLAVAAFPYYLQYARGDVRLHLYGNAILLILFVPAVVVLATLYGPVGAAAAWFAINLMYLVGWVPLIHRRLAPGLHSLWLTRDIVPLILVVTGVAAVLAQLMPTPSSRWAGLVELIVVGTAVLASGMMVPGAAKAWVYKTIYRR